MTFRWLPASGASEGGFYMQDTEVTNATFKAYLEETGGKKDDTWLILSQPAEPTLDMSTPGPPLVNESLLWRDNEFPAGTAGLPVTLVSQTQAEAFTAWLTKQHGDLGVFRLPTADEWNLAAYGQERAYPWGEEFDPARFCHARDPSSVPGRLQLRTSPVPVRSFPNGSTPEELYGMLGNVRELVAPPKSSALNDPLLVNVGTRWMGSGFTDYVRKPIPPRKAMWGYSHWKDWADQTLGFRVLFQPVQRANGDIPQK